ncbi:MAG: DUF4097 domain-containing protein [Gemmatimonadetes bacterium]|nr:DUF4097 domain-containing protein [Gemmatimonadota bacterium]
MRPYSLILLVMGSAPLAAQEFEFTRELRSGATFDLRNIIGDVRIEAATGRRVEVTATKKEGRHGDPNDVEIEAVDTDGGVAICVYYPGQRSRRDDGDRRAERRRENSRRQDRDPCHRGDLNWRGDRNDTEVSFVVRLPAGLEVDIKTVTGDVFGQSIRAEGADFGSVSGNVELVDVQSSRLDANSVSGDVELRQISSAEVSAETVSGDVTFGGEIAPRGRYDFKSLSGDVVLNLPRQPDAEVSASTFSGRFVSDLPIGRKDNRRRHRNRFNVTWGKGGAELDLESFSGDIEVRVAK